MYNSNWDRYKIKDIVTPIVDKFTRICTCSQRNGSINVIYDRSLHIDRLNKYMIDQYVVRCSEKRKKESIDWIDQTYMMIDHIGTSLYFESKVIKVLCEFDRSCKNMIDQ